MEIMGYEEIGYHFGLEDISGNYEVLVGRMMHEVGAHTVGMNRKSLGVMFNGNFDEGKPPREQWNLGIRLIKGLLAVTRLSPSDVEGHRDYASYKTCPGELFDMNRFRADLGK
jgi:N-acetyl-anhydromuramyl-L-alanine amidase AmpD